ncbi:phage portal protein [Viridibacillus arvi]|uniref:phage portal protein n=1 Tax=Viridibacillus arvi TaxID=263475 RepID=UPI003D291D36
MGYFPFQGAKTETDKLNEIIVAGAKTGITQKKMLEKEIAKFKLSSERDWMLKGENYYSGEQDILIRKRMVIGANGELEEAPNLPNNKRLDNQYSILVDQKVNYLLAKPLTVETENEEYQKVLKEVFNRRFHRTLRNMGESSLNNGICWLFPHYNEHSEFTFKRIPGYEILPFWKDSEHTILDYAVRIYTVKQYEGDKDVETERVEIYTTQGIERYILDDGNLVPDVELGEISDYITIKQGEKSQGYNWERVPLVPFKYNHKELPLIKRVKSLQDGINEILSDFDNNMKEDARNTILVLHNYDGQNLGEFRRNLSQYGAVKVRSADGSKGGVDTLTVEVNSTNYESILSLFKKALIQNGRGYDAKDERMGNNPNQMNIQSMYLDIDLDANAIETEYQASFEDLLWFINKHLSLTKKGDFENEEVNVIFNRDILINETEVIESLSKSTDLSIETRIAQHPYVKDVQLELKRLKKERKEEQKQFDAYNSNFPGQSGGGVDVKE